ncbi:MAG: histidine kinase dimerization/phospho-acceptor domain-containing protein [Candidatus Zixiibacteriota bacterium]
MYDAVAQTGPAAANASLWQALDCVDVGLFLLNRDGFLIRYNRAAARIFALSADNWGQQHISAIDTILATGLAGMVPGILDNSRSFCQKNIACTNPNGLYLVLDICCKAVPPQSGEPEMILGVVRESDSSQTLGPDSVDDFEDLNILSTVASSLSSSCELEQILEVILTGATASQGLGFNRAFLFLYDSESLCLKGHLAVGPTSAEEAGNIWRDLESRGLSLDQLLQPETRDSLRKVDSTNKLIENMTFDLTKESMIATACRQGAWINLAAGDEIDPLTASFLDRLGSRNMALVPMVSKGHLTGLLAADCAITGKPISDGAVQLLQILANQAAVAMERSRLYEEQIARASQLEQLNILLGESQDHIIKMEKLSIIGELTAAIAHELRNPLAVVGGFANLMLKSDTSEEQKQYLQIIASETARSEAILNQVLDFHKASMCDQSEFSFSELVDKNLKLLKGRLRKLDVNITLSLAPQPMKIFGNYDQLSHAFYQFFRLVAEDLIPPGSAEVRTERKNNTALMLIKLNVEGRDREKTVKALKQVFSENKASLRLMILVAGETIRYHGGSFGINCEGSSAPTVFVELPLAQEK